MKSKNFIFQKNLKNSKSSNWLVSMLASSNKQKRNIINKLNRDNIETRPIFTPMNKLPMYKSKKSFPIAEKIHSLGFSLPSYPQLTSKDVVHICKLIKKIQ